MRISNRQEPRSIVRLAGCLVCAAALLGCSAGPEPPSGDAPEAAAPATAPDLYLVRGEVVSLPGEGQAGGFRVRHEAIDDFKAADGTVIGMDSMTMRFPVADPALLDGLAVGDKVELRYEVDWDGDPMQQVTAIRRLPAETALVFRDALPPEAP
jgi:hypothetical protein